MNYYIKLKRYLPYIVTLILVGCMTVSAEILNEKEIIFPEITALAIGFLITEKSSWKVNGKRMLGLITVCAVLGVLIVKYVTIGIYPQVVLAFTVSQIIFLFSKTTLAPLISAIVLPVMLQTTSFIYPISAFFLTLAVILFRKLLIKLKIRNNEEYTPVKLNSKNDITDALIRIICVAVIGYIAISLNFKYIIAPPLLVAFTEFSRPKNKARTKPVKTVLVFTGCAFIGAAARDLLNIKFELPLTVAAVTATAIMLIILNYSKMFIPPVGAITILSMIIPKESVLLYPLQIFIGILIIVLLSRILFMYRQNKKSTL